MTDRVSLGPRWTQDGDVAVRGTAFRGGAPVTGRALARHFDVGTLGALAAACDALNGAFGVVVDAGDALLAATDHARTVPLFSGDGRVADRAWDLAEEPLDPTALRPAALDPRAERAFVRSRFVPGRRTLVPGVESLLPGEAVRVTADGVERRRYARYRPTGDGPTDPERCRERLRTALTGAVDRLVAVADDRPVVVPLSGGVDSRLIATLVAARDHPVVGFSFGTRGHPDVEVGRRVAERLGIRWEHAEYDRALWRRWQRDHRDDYYADAFRGDALPFVAALPAVGELLADGRLPADGLYCPGHTVATPSERLPAAHATGEAVADLPGHAIENHFWLWDGDAAANAELRATLSPLAEPATAVAQAAAYEAWEADNRMATFTNGDARLYDFHGLDWWLPLWDRAYVDAWASVPLALRHDKGLHADVTARAYAAEADVPLARARRTDREFGPADRALDALRTAPLTALGDSFDDWFRGFPVPRESWNVPGNHPFGWFGVLPGPLRSAVDPGTSLYALRTLAAVGRVALDPPSLAGVPDDGRVTAEWSNRADATPRNRTD